MAVRMKSVIKTVKSHSGQAAEEMSVEPSRIFMTEDRGNSSRSRIFLLRARKVNTVDDVGKKTSRKDIDNLEI